MRNFAPELERRDFPRRQPNAVCELFVGVQRHDAVIVNASLDGIYLVSDAVAAPETLVRVRLHGTERLARVVRRCQIPHQLRDLARGGMGVRWVRDEIAD